MPSEPDSGNGAAVATAEDSPEIEVMMENPMEGLPDDTDTGSESDHEGLPQPGVEEVPEATDESSEPAEETKTDEADDSEGESGQQTPDVLDPELVGIARSLGMPDATIASLGTSQRLAGFLQGVTESRLQAPKAAGTPGEKPEEVADDFDLGLNPEDYDEKVIDAFKRMHKHHDSQLAEMKGQLETISRSAQEEIAKQKVAVFDHAVGQLGETFEEVFGKGDINAIAPGSKHFQERARLEKAAMALEDSLGIPFDDAVRRAAHALHYDLAQKAARSELRTKVNAQAKHVAPRRTGSPKGHIDPDREALMNISDKLRKWGFG